MLSLPLSLSLFLSTTTTTIPHKPYQSYNDNSENKNNPALTTNEPTMMMKIQNDRCPHTRIFFFFFFCILNVPMKKKAKDHDSSLSFVVCQHLAYFYPFFFLKIIRFAGCVWVGWLVGWLECVLLLLLYILDNTFSTL